jgi:ABC-type transport system involved in Fe-S cluster assembly fused permease/ATPase subunit
MRVDVDVVWLIYCQHEDVAKAATDANASFIDELPDGYSTVVGESGGKLSGGQACGAIVCHLMLIVLCRDSVLPLRDA